MANRLLVLLATSGLAIVSAQEGLVNTRACMCTISAMHCCP
jgi:hypothetical protein